MEPELVWVSDTLPGRSDHADRRIEGRAREVGPFSFGKFRYIDDRGGGFIFFFVRGTRLGHSWEW